MVRLIVLNFAACRMACNVTVGQIRTMPARKRFVVIVDARPQRLIAGSSIWKGALVNSNRYAA
jgi:hypothetical protein